MFLPPAEVEVLTIATKFSEKEPSNTSSFGGDSEQRTQSNLKRLSETFSLNLTFI